MNAFSPAKAWVVTSCSVRTYGSRRISAVCIEAPTRACVVCPPPSVITRSRRASKKKKPRLAAGRTKPLRLQAARRPGVANTENASRVNLV